MIERSGDLCNRRVRNWNRILNYSITKLPNYRRCGSRSRRIGNREGVSERAEQRVDFDVVPPGGGFALASSGAKIGAAVRVGRGGVVVGIVPVAAPLLEVVRKGDNATGGHYLEFPTVAELLHNQGMRTIIAGAKGVVLLEDRATRPGNALGINLFAGEVLPDRYARQLTGALGEFPAQGPDGLARDLWTTRALIGPSWDDGVPPFSLLWLSEPDRSQHETGPGSAASIAAIGTRMRPWAECWHASMRSDFARRPT